MFLQKQDLFCRKPSALNHFQEQIDFSVEQVFSLCRSGDVTLLFSASVSCSFISSDSNNTTTQTATTWSVCVCVFNSGTAAHKVSLIWWQRAHWTTDRELNPLLMKLCSNTHRLNSSTVFLRTWLRLFCLCLCVLVFVFLWGRVLDQRYEDVLARSSFIKPTVWSGSGVSWYFI